MRQKIVVNSMMMVLAILLMASWAHGANIQLANMWLHHSMDPMDLTHHFGVGSPHQVNPDMYQLIKIQTNDDADKLQTVSKRSEKGKAAASVSFTAFGEERTIQMQRNWKLVSKEAKMFLTDGVEKSQIFPAQDTCHHFLHSSDDMSAAFTRCHHPSK